jgi:hypothetical protein
VSRMNHKIRRHQSPLGLQAFVPGMDKRTSAV